MGPTARSMRRESSLDVVMRVKPMVPATVASPTLNRRGGGGATWAWAASATGRSASSKDAVFSFVIIYGPPTLRPQAASTTTGIVPAPRP